MDKNAFYARRMHTPDDPARARLREALRELSRALIPLHRNLIDHAKQEYAIEHGPLSPTQLLRLLGDDPFFAWLKPITSLIVDIDEMAQIDFEAPDAARITERVEALFDGNTNEFSIHYVPILQRNVDVAMEHAAVRQAVAKLKD